MEKTIVQDDTSLLHKRKLQVDSNSSESEEHEEEILEMTEETIGKWNKKISENIEERKKKLIKYYSFSEDDFASEEERCLGLDFSIKFMDKCYPEEFFSWSIEKQAQMANAEVRAPVLHEKGWSMIGIRNNLSLIVTILRLISVFRVNSEIMGNLAFQSLYSNDRSCRSRAYLVYYICSWLAWFCQPKKLIASILILVLIWLLLPKSIPYGIYYTIYSLLLVSFMWCLFHLNLYIGDYRRILQAQEQGNWHFDSNRMNLLKEREKDIFNDMRLRVWGSRMQLAKRGDSLKKEI